MTVQPLKRRRAARVSGEHLHEEILDATTDVLMQTGHAKAVSIRSVAQRVGVTPPSIYLHFTDKDALLDAVCARYFEHLDEVMQQVVRDQPSTIDRLARRAWPTSASPCRAPSCTASPRWGRAGREATSTRR